MESMKKTGKDLYLTEKSLRDQTAATVLLLVSGLMSLAMLAATWDREHDPGPARDYPCLTTLPRLSMGISVLTTAYYLHNAVAQRAEAPGTGTDLLLAASLLGAAATALRADVLFFGIEGLPEDQRVDLALGAVE